MNDLPQIQSWIIGGTSPSYSHWLKGGFANGGSSLSGTSRIDDKNSAIINLFVENYLDYVHENELDGHMDM